MRHHLNKLSLLWQKPIRNSRRNLVMEMAALAAAGAGVLWSSNPSSDTKTTVSVSVSPQLRELAYLAFPAKQEIPSSISSPDASPSGLRQILFSRTESVPSTDYKKGEVGDGSKCCSGCLGRDSIANAASKVGPAVVNLRIKQGSYGSIGSGTIIDSDGTILTCAHVVTDLINRGTVSKGKKVDVTLQDGRAFEGTILNVDFHSDIAVVKIKSESPLPTARLGTSSKIRPGDWVIAMGCPLSLQNTITAGIVSCVDRSNTDLGLGGVHREYLQTDCAINAGNSGGPLVNLNGEVVGVNIMKIMAADGLGFAIPIDSVSQIVDDFRKNGCVVRPWLGLTMLDLNEMILAQLKKRDPMFPDVSKGVLVCKVTSWSPADHAGFHLGDVIIEFDGKPVGSTKEIMEIIRDKVGTALKVVVKRRGNTNPVTLTIVPVGGNLDM